ncbi:MAG: hypothetical protein WAS51_08865, partial [Ilumatobacteraceae bacterium]
MDAKISPISFLILLALPICVDTLPTPPTRISEPVPWGTTDADIRCPVVKADQPDWNSRRISCSTWDST